MGSKPPCCDGCPHKRYVIYRFNKAKKRILKFKSAFFYLTFHLKYDLIISGWEKRFPIKCLEKGTELSKAQTQSSEDNTVVYSAIFVLKSTSIPDKSRGADDECTSFSKGYQSHFFVYDFRTPRPHLKKARF